MCKPGKTPFQLGYRMPAEWEPHSATQLHWPSNRDTWPGDRLQKVEEVYLNIIDVLHRFEPVILLADLTVDTDSIVEKLREREMNLSSINIYSVPINDVWARDCGPIFIKQSANKTYAITDWEYNAWGEKYPPFDDDNRLPGWFADTFELKRFTPNMLLEGGSIETNGAGDFLTTESVLLNPNRNPDHSKADIETKLRDFLGAENIIWLKSGLAGDDTDGHIDDLSRFLNQDTILTVVSNDTEDVNYDVLQENYSRLKKAKNKKGNPFHIETLPLPNTKIKGITVDGSEVVPASYTNYYIANGVVLVPLYDDRYDEMALNLFNKYFPGRNIEGIPCSDLVWGQGSIHCITQQIYSI